MARRVSLPTAVDLFRDTGATQEAPQPLQRRAGTPGQPSGRVRHDEKVTVYLTSGELMDLESARLRLRADHGIAVDRGRMVREAVALALADLEAEGGASPLARRLQEP